MAEIIYGWNNEPIGLKTSKGENPMLVHGYGPPGKHCHECKHFYQESHHGKLNYKCDQRKATRGAGSDHRKYWPTCGKFEEKA